MATIKENTNEANPKPAQASAKSSPVVFYTIAFLAIVAICLALVTFDTTRKMVLPELIWLPVIIGVGFGLRSWQTEVNDKRPNREQLSAYTVILCFVFWLLISTSLYAMSRTMWLASESVSAMFVGVIWGLAAAASGGIIGFLFGVSRAVYVPPANAGQEGAAAPAQQTVRMTNLEQISSFLTTIITGGTVFQAHKLGSYVQSLGVYFQNISSALAIPGTDAMQSDWLQVLGSASAVYFAIAGFLSVYMLTKLFLAPAIEQAEQIMGIREESSKPLDDALQSEMSIDDLALFSDTPRLPGDEATAFAKKVVGTSMDKLRDWREFRIYGKSLLVLGKAREAVTAFRKGSMICPDDAETHLCLAVAIQKAECQQERETLAKLPDSIRRSILTELEAARDGLNRRSDSGLRKNIYKSLTFTYLYLQPADGFLKCLAAAREYLSLPNVLSSAGVFLNVACAYGQALCWAKNAPEWNVASADLQIPREGLAAVPTAKESLTEWLKREAIFYIQKALARKPGFVTAIRSLSGLDAGATDDGDLVPLKDEIKQLLEKLDLQTTTGSSSSSSSSESSESSSSSI